MKKWIFTVLVLLISIQLSAQINSEKAVKAYPATYTFEGAAALVEAGETDIALWHYINLYPVDKDRTVEAVMALKPVVEAELSVAIQQAFATYGPWDPQTTTIIEGTPNLDMAKFQMKGAAGDALIIRTSGEDIEDEATALNRQGIEFLENNFFEQAIEKFTAAIALRETGPFHFNRGFAYTMTGRHRAAIEDFSFCVGSLTRLSEAYFERGYNQEQLENFEDAISDYTLAIAVNRKYAEAYNNRGFIYFTQGKFEKALADFDMAIKIRPSFGGAYINRGYLYKELGQTDNACRDWGKASDFGLTSIFRTILEYCQEQ